MGVRVLEREKAVEIRLEWPEKRNAMGPEEAVELSRAIVSASARGKSVLILSGEGAFCAGGDLAYLVRSSASVDQMRTVIYEDFQAIIRALHDSPMLTVAAVDGAALGLGMDLALACDVRFVGPDGWLQQKWAAVGLIAGTGGIGFLSRHHPDLLWQTLEQRRLDAAACAEVGIARSAPESAHASSIALAEQMSYVSRELMSEYVRLHRMITWPEPSYFEECALVQARLLVGSEFATKARQILAKGAVASEG